MTYPTHRSSSSWQSSSRFKEHLSSAVPSTTFQVAPSKFSPDSLSSHGTSRGSSTKRSHSSANSDVEAGTTRRSRYWKMKDRLTKFFFSLRTIGREPDLLPIQMAPWSPLRIEKRRCTCHEESKKRHKRNIYWMIVPAIILFYLLADSIFLNTAVVSLRSSLNSMPDVLNPSNNSTNSMVNNNTLSAEMQQCISQYELNAPSNPSTYPCSTCLPLLQSIPANAISANAQEAQQVLNAIQFCGLSAMFNEVDVTGQAGMSTGGWLTNVKFCAWTGVTCDGSGRVSSLQLTFPGVPAAIPNNLGSLQGLQTLQIIGNNVLPGGSLPPSFANLTSLSNLHIESTAIISIPDNLFMSLTSITTLTLVDNTLMSANLPSSLLQTSLQNLIVNGQFLSNPLDNITSNPSFQSSLRLIDLTATNITGTIPSTISALSSLAELHLDSNDLQPPLPGAFPVGLQDLSLSNNSALSGTVPGEVCTSTALTTCDFQGTGLSPANGGACGACTFG